MKKLLFTLVLVLFGGLNSHAESVQEKDREFYPVELWQDSEVEACFQVSNEIIDWEVIAKRQNLGVDFIHPERSSSDQYDFSPGSTTYVTYKAPITHDIENMEWLLFDMESVTQVYPSYLKGKLVFKYSDSAENFDYPDFRGLVCSKVDTRKQYIFSTLIKGNEKIWVSPEEIENIELNFIGFKIKANPENFQKIKFLTLTENHTTQYVIVEWPHHQCSKYWQLFRIEDGVAKAVKTNGGGCD